jgi:hypothetical protein
LQKRLIPYFFQHPVSCCSHSHYSRPFSAFNSSATFSSINCLLSLVITYKIDDSCQNIPIIKRITRRRLAQEPERIDAVPCKEFANLVLTLNTYLRRQVLKLTAGFVLHSLQSSWNPSSKYWYSAFKYFIPGTV